jgi:hypothetical protein
LLDVHPDLPDYLVAACLLHSVPDIEEKDFIRATTMVCSFAALWYAGELRIAHDRLALARTDLAAATAPLDSLSPEVHILEATDLLSAVRAIFDGGVDLTDEQVAPYWASQDDLFLLRAYMRAVADRCAGIRVADELSRLLDEVDELAGYDWKAIAG